MKYEQLTGKLFLNNGDLLGIGYAGYKEGKNNPDMEHVHDIGPIPKGRYYMDKPIDSNHTGPYSIPLIPDSKNEMFGRNSFMMHGDNPTHDASHGCIIQNRFVRETAYNSGDKIIDVI